MKLSIGLIEVEPVIGFEAWLEAPDGMYNCVKRLILYECKAWRII